MPISFPDIVTLTTATCMIYVVKHPGFGAILVRLDSFADDPECAVVRAVPGWWRTSFLCYMRSMYNLCLSGPRSPPEYPKTNSSCSA
eukprot:4724490-Pyramimonas_sp.AAC.1